MRAIVDWRARAKRTNLGCVTELFAPVVSITRTQRGRFFWAAWWSAPPVAHPFRKPDASNGGARTHDEAMREAESIAARSLTEIEPRWARAVVRTLRGLAPFTSSELNAAARGEGEHAARVRPRGPEPAGLWSVLGVDPRASADEIKRAYRQRALATHPDQGGDAEAFRALHDAYERAMRRRAKQASRPRAKR